VRRAKSAIEAGDARAPPVELKLTVPMSDAVGRVPEGATLLPTVAAKNGATDLNVYRLAATSNWRGTSRIPRGGNARRARGDRHALARLDGHSIFPPRRLLSVRSYGAPFDRFSVRLPPSRTCGRQPERLCRRAYRSGVGESEHRRLVEVRLPKKTAGR